MNIVLADLPKKEFKYDLSYPSLAILYLISYAREYFQGKHNFYYLEGHCTLDEHIKKIRKINPDVYGITITSPVSLSAYKTIRVVKQNFPKLIIIAGGPHPTAMPEHVFEHSPVDICVRGEGEITFAELIDYFSGSKKNINNIKGISYLDKEKKVIHTEKRELISNLDDIPIPAWDCVKDFHIYPGMHFNKSSPQSCVLVSRGCPFDCNFCSNPVWKHNKPWVRLRSPQKIAEEVQYLWKLGVREIYLEADEVNVSAKWAEDVCEHIASLGHKKDLFFHINVRADIMTLSLAKKLASINIWLAHLGIESGNQRTLDGIGKKVKIEDIIQTCQYLKEANIKVFSFLMLFHAWEDNTGRLCWEDVNAVNRTILFAKELFNKKLIHYFSWQVATPFPGSRLWELAKKHNLIVNTASYHGIRTRAMKLPGIDEKDVQKAVRKGVAIKTYYALKSGHINFRHLWGRGWESIKNIFGVKTFGSMD